MSQSTYYDCVAVFSYLNTTTNSGEFPREEPLKNRCQGKGPIQGEQIVRISKKLKA